MNTSKIFTPPRIVALILSSLIPLAVIAFILISGVLINTFTAVTFIICPIIALAGNFFIITSKMRAWLKSLLCTILILALLFSSFIAFLFGPFETITSYKGNRAEIKYTEFVENDPLLPQLSETGNPESVEYYDYYARIIFFFYESDTLICKYNEQDYTEQKTLLDEKYVFQTEELVESGYSCEPTVQIDNYTFRFLSVDEYDLYYPKEVYLIATNDTTREIAYISFYDIDLDFISDATDFINGDCGWEHIR